MIPLTLILRKTQIIYQLKKGGEKINHLLFMDDLKLFAKSEKQINSLVNAVRIFWDDIRMEFVNNEERKGCQQRSDCYASYGNTIKCIEEGSGYKYLGIVEVDGIKLEEITDQISKEYVGRLRIVKSKRNGGNIISAINSRAVSIIRYGAGIIGWTKADLQALDRKTRKMLTMYGAHHPKADVDRLYLKRGEGGRGLLGVKDCVRIEIDRYMRTSREELLKAADRDDVFGNNSYSKSKEDVQQEHETAYKGKTLHGQFRGSKSCDWLRKGYLKKETESTIIAAQDQALCTNNIRKVVYGDVSPLCRLYTSVSIIH